MIRASRRITSADVARAAGVSRTTVSFVLNDKPGVAIPEETRRRILQAARDLDYRPHASARALRAGHSDIVLLAVPDWSISHGIARVIEELGTALAARNLTLVSHLEGAHGRSLADVCAAVGAAAVVGLRPFDQDTVQALHRAGASVVLPSLDAGSLPPMRQLGRLQARHLINLGHQHLGYALPTHAALRHVADECLAGAAAACAEAGLPAPVVMSTAIDEADAAQVVRRWREEEVTGVCAANDETALAVLAGTRSLGLEVPGDLAVIGADDIPAAQVSDPPLTSIRYDYRNIASTGAAAVAASLTGTPVSSVTSVAEPLVVQRSST